MKTTALVLSLSSALLVFGCTQPPPAGGDTEKRVAKLETEVSTLQGQNRDLRRKLGAFHVFGRDPLGDFFASPEFWQCTYDSSWADCSKRCSDQTAAGFKICQAKPTEAERTACFKDNSDRGSNCLKNCPVPTSPIDPVNCV